MRVIMLLSLLISFGGCVAFESSNDVENAGSRNWVERKPTSRCHDGASPRDEKCVGRTDSSTISR
jgi:hypothetical protein